MAEKVKFFLLFLAEAKGNQVKALLQTSSKDQVLGLREVAANLLQGNIPIDENQKVALQRFRSFFRELASKSVTRSKLVKNSKPISLLLHFTKSTLLQL